MRPEEAFIFLSCFIKGIYPACMNDPDNHKVTNRQIEAFCMALLTLDYYLTRSIENRDRGRDRVFCASLFGINNNSERCIYLSDGGYTRLWIDEMQVPGNDNPPVKLCDSTPRSKPRWDDLMVLCDSEAWDKYGW